jgi:hypothetical protein
MNQKKDERCTTTPRQKPNSGGATDPSRVT